MMYLSLIRKVDNYKMFAIEHIPVKITLEEGKVKSISPETTMIHNEETFAEICEYINGKEIEERKSIKVDKMFYITFTSCPERSDKLFYAGRRLKELLQYEVENQIYELEDLKRKIEESRDRFA